MAIERSYACSALLLLNAALLLYIAQSMALHRTWAGNAGSSLSSSYASGPEETGGGGGGGGTGGGTGERFTGRQLETPAEASSSAPSQQPAPAPPAVRASQGGDTTRALDGPPAAATPAVTPSPRSPAQRARDAILRGSRDAAEAALGAADTDGRTCDAAGVPAFNATVAWRAMHAALPTAYEETTYCEDWGRSCVQGDEFVLFEDRFQVKDGFWRRYDNAITQKLKRLMFWIAWGGGNPDIYNGNLKRYDVTEGFFKAWPAGADASPPVPFARCNTPLVLFWEFPENFYHTMVMWSSVWAAVRGGALDPRLSLALVTAHAGAPYTLAPPDYITLPAAMLFKRSVTTFSHLSQHGQPPHGVGGGAAAGARVAFPPTRCFDRMPICLATSYSERPPLHFYEFMQAVKDELLGRPRNFDATSPALIPYAWPDGVTHVSGPDGALRVTLAMREAHPDPPGWRPAPGGRVHTRRVLNFDELMGNCSGSGGARATLSLRGQPVPVVCRAYSFGEAGGMHGDVRAMQETDVLVAVHGAGLTNLGFLRPGATVLELRPGGFDAKNADRFYRPFARASGCLKWWSLRLHGKLQVKGWFESRNAGNNEKYGRDKDLVVPWPKLREALEAALTAPYADWAAAETANKVFTDAS